MTVLWPLAVAVLSLIGWLMCDGSSNPGPAKAAKVFWALFCVGAFWTVAVLASKTLHF